MDSDGKAAAAIAEKYFDVTSPLVRLGWGISGYVFKSPDARTAVKIHRQHESFWQELAVYQRLKKLRITGLHGLGVPKLRDHRSEIKLLRMDFMSPPYLLDFAGARFEPPDFPEDTMTWWHAGIDEAFGDKAEIAYAVYRTLAAHGIYYMDFRPSNMNLTGLSE